MLLPLTRRTAVAASLGMALAVPSFLVSSALRAQDAGAPITLDFQALLPSGQPVLDLTAEQVSLKVDGKDRKLASLQLVRADTAPGTTTAPTLPAPFASNAAEGGGGRSVIFIVHEDSIRPGIERVVRDAISQMMTTLAPGDRVGLMTAPRGTITIDPTTTRATISDALGRVAGRFTPTDDGQRPCRSRDLLDALRGLLAGMPGAAPTVVLFSAEMVNPVRSTGAGGNNVCELQPNDFSKVGVAASEARALVYIVQPDTASTTNLEGLQSLAGVTGGQYQRLATDTNPLARITTETSARYVATFVPEPSERNGQSHRIELKVAREGVVVRARNEIAIARGGSKATANPKDMVKVTTPYRDLPLRATAFSSRDASGKIKLIFLAEPADPAAKITAATVGLVEPTANKLVVQSSADEKMAAATPLMLSTLVDAGTYRARLAVTDATGKAGAVDIPVKAELSVLGDFKFSTMLLSAISAQGARPALQFGPADTAANMMIEIYGPLPSAKIGAVVEIAATPDGPALAQGKPPTVRPTAADAFAFSSELPIGALAPGDYVVRATIGLNDQQITLTRTLRKIK